MSQIGARPMPPISTKRGPYAPKACAECQRRKTKCTQERPCPNCRSRKVECRSWDHDEPKLAPAKRPRSSARENDTSTIDPLSLVTEQTVATLNEANKSLREELKRLRQDVDSLSKIRSSVLAETSISNPLPSTEYHRQQPYESLYPVTSEDSEVQGTSPPSLTHTDTFNPSSVWGSPDAIANKIGMIRSTVFSNMFSNESLGPSIANNRIVSLTLPAPTQLRRQIDLFLTEFDDFFPFFRCATLKRKISAVLHSLSYGDLRTTLQVPWQHCTTFGILCEILSSAEMCRSSNNSLDPSAGQHWFLQGKRIMEEFEDIVGDSIGTVTYHVLAGGRMMEAEKLRTAVLHVARALQSALSIGLNDDKRCKEDPGNFVSPRCLFWVLYFQEKRIHYKCGIPYLLRPSDIYRDLISPIVEVEIDDVKLELVETMIKYSQLWTSIWTNFVAPNGKLTGNWVEVQITDVRVKLTYQTLAQRVRWESDKAQEYFDSGISETTVRQKLQVFLWYQSLRLVIRQASAQSILHDIERRDSCIDICKAIVAAIGKYMENYHCMRPLGYFLTCSLVECLFHLRQEQISEATSVVGRSDVQNTISVIANLLENLALSVGSAQRALAAVRCVLTGSEDFEYSLGFGENSNNMDPVHWEAYDAFT